MAATTRHGKNRFDPIKLPLFFWQKIEIVLKMMDNIINATITQFQLYIFFCFGIY